MTPGVKPESFRALAIAITAGVFPVPPTVMLPTTMMGTLIFVELSMPIRNSSRLAAVNSKKTSARGNEAIDSAFRRAHERGTYFKSFMSARKTPIGLGCCNSCCNLANDECLGIAISLVLLRRESDASIAG